MSEGLLVPARNSAEIGEDLAAELKITRYDPDEHEVKENKNKLYSGGEAGPAPPGIFYKYDLESWNKYKWRFQEGEQVIITEKFHGEGARYVNIDGTFYVGSRNEWKKEYPSYNHVKLEDLAEKVGLEKATEILDKLHSKPKQKNKWWKLVDQCPYIRRWCELNPGRCIYGELIGTQNLNYNCTDGKIDFTAFDVLDTRTGQFYDMRLAEDFGNMQWVTELYAGPYSDDKVRELTSGKSRWWMVQHIREGCVVRSLKEEVDPRLGRKVLKSVSSDYLSKEK